MATKDGDFLKRLLATFRVEADEHLTAMSSGLVELEKTPAAERSPELVEKIFREAHSLKGAARAVNLTAVEAVCQPLESVFAALKRGQLATPHSLFDLLHEAVGALRKLVADGGEAPDASAPSFTASLSRRLEAASKGLSSAEPEKRTTTERTDPDGGSAAPDTEVRESAKDDARVPSAERRAAAETVRVATAKLDSLLRQAEELASLKLAAAERVSKLRSIAAELAALKRTKEKTRPRLLVAQTLHQAGGQEDRQGQTRLDLTRLLEGIDREGVALASLETSLSAMTTSAEQESRALAKMVDGLIEDTKKVLMLPFSSLLDGFPAVVRELSRDRGKEAELVIAGGEIEIDRRILEEMKDPLIHLVRNCVDHGIEPPASRARAIKPPRGTITIAIRQKDAGRAEILVSDDGAGIDLARVRLAAEKLGIVSAEEASRLNDQDAMSLVFRSGVSTSPIVTELSGRGLGLAIVLEKVQKLGGAVFVESRRDSGTTFRVVLPLTLAAFRGVVVRLETRRFVIPTTGVERVARVNKEDIKTVENRETLQLEGRAVSLVRLRDVLELPVKGVAEKSAGYDPVVVLVSGSERIAFLVDEIVSEQEVLAKGLGKQLSRVPNVAGAAMLGTGTLAPILSVPDLMKSAVKGAVSRGPRAVAEAVEAAKRTVLVVEDSITARSLLKNILEAAGYEVKTAVDGVDALTTLKTGEFDIVVSDIEMPRMDGFDLTARIRADRKLAELPVVLVTALGSREHRERGIDVGANAYIVKSSFDQSNLLDVIKTLV